MNDLLVVVMGVLTFTIAVIKGARWTFFWFYVPVLILVPSEIRSQLPGMTDLSVQCTAGLGLLGGYYLRKESFPIKWHWFDWLALFPVLSFSIAYGMGTDANGFFHRFRVCMLEWAFPYLFVRMMIRNYDDFLDAVKPLALSSLMLSFLAVWECRMAVRLAPSLWEKAGFEVTVLDHLGGWRWGFLRAAAGMGHPLSLGTFFATVAPLMMQASFLEVKPALRWFYRLTLLVCVAGVISSLSRGPIMVTAGALLIPLFVTIPKQIWIPVILLLSILAVPVFMDAAEEEIKLADTHMKKFGNTTSGHYRVALFLVYGRQIAEVGWWGDATVKIDPDFKKAWSIDNAYIFLFLTGGWIGGGAFCAIILILVYQSLKKMFRLAPQVRRLYSMTFASLVGVAGCMANVWFAADYAPFFWMACALMFNLVWKEPKCKMSGEYALEGSATELIPQEGYT